VWKVFFESGAPQKEETFRVGKRQGASKTWWANGKPASVEDYVDDKCTKAKRWDKDGKLAADEEYEADGSRRLKR
jgi:antitoxin component YwqK of YwqJK toxin-antitoxin module